MSQDLVYDGSLKSLRQVFALAGTETKVLCPRCRSELVVIIDAQTAAEKKLHPSIFCPRDKRHVFDLLNLRDSKDAFRAFLEERDKDTAGG